MSTWVRQEANPADVDLETIAANHNVIKVNDVNEGDDAKVAVHAINSSTDQDARALKVEGKADIDGVHIRNVGAGQIGDQLVVDSMGADELFVGAYFAAGDVHVGKEGRIVTVEGTPLTLTGTVLCDKMDAHDANLELGTEGNNTYTLISRSAGTILPN